MTGQRITPLAFFFAFPPPEPARPTPARHAVAYNGGDKRIRRIYD